MRETLEHAEKSADNLYNWSAFHCGRLLVIITGLGFGLRAAHYFLSPQLQRDSCYYLLFMQEWLNGVPYREIGILPGENTFPLLPGAFMVPTAFVSLTGLPLESVAIWYNIILGTAIIPLMYRGVNEIFPQKRFTALVSALLTAVHPVMIEFSATVLRETSYLFFCILYFISMIMWMKSYKIRQIGLAGIFSGLAVMSRIEGTALPLITVTILLACTDKPECGTGWRGAAVYALCLTATLAATAYITGADGIIYVAAEYISRRIMPWMQTPYFR